MELGGGSAEKKMGGGGVVGAETVGEKKGWWWFCVEGERVWMRQGRADCWIGEAGGALVLVLVLVSNSAFRVSSASKARFEKIPFPSTWGARDAFPSHTRRVQRSMLSGVNSYAALTDPLVPSSNGLGLSEPR